MEPIKLSQGTAQRDDAGNLHIDQSGHHVILNAADAALIGDYLQLPLPPYAGPKPFKAPASTPLVSTPPEEAWHPKRGYEWEANPDPTSLQENTVSPESVVPPLKKSRKPKS
jgi:hypothetical protein